MSSFDSVADATNCNTVAHVNISKNPNCSNMELQDFFKNGKIHVWKETYAVVKSKKPHPKAFANIVDRNETTAIVDQSELNEEEVIEIEKEWKLLTFEMVLPFGLVGFLAKIAQALAEENISIFAISSYSTDHLLVKEKDLGKAIKKLGALGFTIDER